MRDVNFLLLGTGQETDISVCMSPCIRSSPADVVPPSNKTYRHKKEMSDMDINCIKIVKFFLVCLNYNIL